MHVCTYERKIYVVWVEVLSLLIVKLQYHNILKTGRDRAEWETLMAFLDWKRNFVLIYFTSYLCDYKEK